MSEIAQWEQEFVEAIKGVQQKQLEGQFLFELAEIEVRQSGGYWHVVELSHGRCVRLVGKPHRFRWVARLKARRTTPGYWATPMDDSAWKGWRP